MRGDMLSLLRPTAGNFYCGTKIASLICIFEIISDRLTTIFVVSPLKWLDDKEASD